MGNWLYIYIYIYIKKGYDFNYWINQKPALCQRIYVGWQNYKMNIKTIPGGIPASSARAPSARADNGVSSAGLTTQVHPAARAAATWTRVCKM